MAPARPTGGVSVHGPDGASIGVLTMITSQGSLVERPLRPAVYVPFEAIATVHNEQLTLRITADQVDGMPWRHADERLMSCQVPLTVGRPPVREAVTGDEADPRAWG